MLGKHRLSGAFLIQTGLIRPDPNQPRRRLDTDAQREINNSVKRLGILQAITVRFIEAEKIYRIITGQRRFYAACEAGLPEVPYWVQSPREKEALLHQIVENWQRLDMQPYDLADALARLRDTNRYAQKDLARETGKSEGEISKLLALLSLDPAVQKLAREDHTGRISRRHLYAVRCLPAEQQLTLIRKAQEEGVPAADMELLAAKQTATGAILRPIRRQGANDGPCLGGSFQATAASCTRAPSRRSARSLATCSISRCPNKGSRSHSSRSRAASTVIRRVSVQAVATEVIL
jgi:ParB/RepB/Spo0J family partition protein